MGNQSPNPNSSKHNPDESRDWIKYSGLAFEIVAYNLIVIWGGYRLDKLMGNRIPWFIIVGLVLSIVGTLYMIFSRINNNSN